MNSLKPYSAFNTSLAADFPALLMLLHQDDIVAGDTQWADRVTGCTFLFDGPVAKDAGGVYAEIDPVLVTSVAGTLPTVLATKYLVCVSIAVSTTATGGMTVNFGDQASGLTYITSGTTYSEVPAQRSVAPTLTAPPTTANKPSCQVASFDMVDTASPTINRAQANDTNQVIGYGTGTTTDTLAISAGIISAPSALSTALYAPGLARQKLMAMLAFDTAIPYTELKLACAEMARTGELYAGWRGRT